MDAGIADDSRIFSDNLHGLVGFFLIIKLYAAAFLCKLQAGNGFQKLLLSVARHTGNTQNFSAVGIKGNVL